MHKCEIEGAKVTVFPAEGEGRPAIYLNSYEGEETFARLKEAGADNFNLVAIGVRDWFCDLVPWNSSSPFKDGRKFVGGGGEYLNLLTQKIVPAAEGLLSGISWRGIAGYSLGGLFAVWSLYNTGVFTRMASCSGSLWFEGLMPYINSTPLKCNLQSAYFSLGDREAGKTGSPTHSVAQNTRSVAESYAAMGVRTNFSWERGGHNADPVGRVARAIEWLLRED